MWFCLHHLHTLMENIYGRDDDEVIMTLKDLKQQDWTALLFVLFFPETV